MPGRAFILPSPGRAVRVIAGDRSPLADVRAATPERIELVPREAVPGGAAQLMYSTPRGVVLLAGELEAGDVAVFVPREQQRADQRREAYRVPVHGPVELRRAGGDVVRIVALDLSAAGALMTGPADVEEGEQVTLIVALGEDQVALPAVVTRREADDRIGVRFLDPPRAALRALERFVAGEQRKLL
jgi:hypothetical protein